MRRCPFQPEPGASAEWATGIGMTFGSLKNVYGFGHRVGVLVEQKLASIKIARGGRWPR
jgi:hypothetical protein